jgi:hypothetical protein
VVVGALSFLLCVCGKRTVIIYIDVDVCIGSITVGGRSGGCGGSD